MRVIKIVVGVVLLVVVLAATCLGTVAYRGTRLDASSKAYVDEVVPLIVTSWEVETALSRFSPEMLKAVSKDKLDLLFSACWRKLGPLKQYQGAKGDAFMAINNGNQVTTARYVVQADFEHGPATIEVRLIQHDEQWQLLGLSVNSDLLLMP